MTLYQQLTEDMKNAMRARDAETLGTIRFLLAEIKNVEIDEGQQDDAAVQKIIARQIKQMKDAMADFEKGGRPELVAAEQTKVAVLEKYLPTQLSDDELQAIVKTAVDQAGDAPNMGAVMGPVMKAVAGRADGNRVSAMVKAMLS